MITLWPLAHRRNKASVFVFLPEPRDERGNVIDTCMGDRNLTALTSWHVAAPVTNTRVFFQAARLVCHVFWSALARRRRSRWFVRLWQPANTMCSHIWLHYIFRAVLRPKLLANCGEARDDRLTHAPAPVTSALMRASIYFVAKPTKQTQLVIVSQAQVEAPPLHRPVRLDLFSL